MCGFLVEIDIDNNLSDRNQFIKSSKILINRGPDHYKYESDGEFFQSGFCRLSIIDSSEMEINQWYQHVVDTYVYLMENI